MMTIVTRWKYIAAAFLIASVVIPLSIFTMQSEPSSAAPATIANEKPVSLRFGPGTLASTNPSPRVSASSGVDPWAPSGLAVTSDQHLVLNSEMRIVFDYFLQPDSPGDRSARLARLQNYLKATLPASAYSDAMPLVSDYARYLAAHDRLNAGVQAQAQTAQISTEQLTAHMTEVSRLRQSLLGVHIAQLWFADEEVGMQQYIARHGVTPQLSLSDADK